MNYSLPLYVPLWAFDSILWVRSLKATTCELSYSFGRNDYFRMHPLLIIHYELFIATVRPSLRIPLQSVGMLRSPKAVTCEL